MPTISDRAAYGGFQRKVERLGMAPLLAEVEQLICGFEFLLKPVRHANGAAGVRQTLDDRFEAQGGWRIIKSGGIDWTKTLEYGPATVCMGVELQISARSDLLTNDLTHLIAAMDRGDVDVGVIVVPSDSSARYLTDRCPRFSYAQEHVRRAKAEYDPILLLAIEHDGTSNTALPKQTTNVGKKKGK